MYGEDVSLVTEFRQPESINIIDDRTMKNSERREIVNVKDEVVRFIGHR